MAHQPVQADSDEGAHGAPARRPGFAVRAHLRPAPGLHGPVPRQLPDPRLEKKLLRQAGQAIARFGLIDDGDRILVCLSGGKDSFALLHILQLLQQRAPIRFELVACNLDQGQPGFPAEVLEGYLREQHVEAALLFEDTYAVVKRLVPEGKTTCSVCSRLRRGILYSAAKRLGCSKIALGHHRDDLIESLLMSMLFTGKTRSMPPKLRSRDGQSTVIRPLCGVAEKDLAAFAGSAGFPIIPCNLCGSQENLQRKRVKRLLGDLDREHGGGVRESLFAAMGNVMPEHLLDQRLQQGPAVGPDLWIEEEEACEAPALAKLRVERE